MQIAATPTEAQTILKAMRVVAEAGSALTAADRASIVAAARYIFKLTLPPDLAGLTPPKPDELKALAANPDLATEAVRFATVMAFVDGTLDNTKLGAVLTLAATLGVEADFVHDIAEITQGHVHEATAHMIRANLESITGKPWTTDDDAMAFFLPYKGAKADPALAARFHALAQLPEGTFGHAFAVFYLSQKYAFPGQEAALNIKFAAPHDSSHLLAAMTRLRAASCWCLPSPPPCIARKRCPAMSCRCCSAGISASRSTKLPARPRARSIHRSSGTPGRAANG